MKKEKKKWYTSVTNWIITIACIILVPILVINVWIMAQSSMNKDKVPSIFGIKPFMVLSGSMESAIHRGDLIFTKTVDPETLKVDDIIAFHDTQGTITTHRIIDIIEKDGSTYFVTKGDSNSSQDLALAEPADVEGVYVARIPGIGSMMDTLSQPTTIIILVLGITAAFAIGFMISNKREAIAEKREFLEYKKMKEQEEQPTDDKKEKTSPGDTAPVKKDGTKKKPNKKA